MQHTKDNELHIHNASSTGHRMQDFLPLIGVLSVVVILTVVSTLFFSVDVMLGFMGWFFLVFGGLKIIRLKGFVEAYRMYDLLAKRSAVYAYLYPFIEFGFGLAYLFSWYLLEVSVVVAIVMLVGAAGVYIKLRQREEIPCACLGTVFKVPMTWVTLGEDMLMAGMAIYLIITLSLT